MYSIDQLEELSFLNIPYTFYEICMIYPLTVQEVVMNREVYDICLYLLTITKYNITKAMEQKGIQGNEITDIDPFEYLIANMKLDEEIRYILTKGFRLFTHEKITILFDSLQIILGSPEEKRILDKENFSEFQNVLRIQNHIPEVGAPIKDEDPRARYFREKREMRDAIKRQQEQGESPSFVSSMSALCAYSGLTAEEIRQMSLFSFLSLLKFYQRKENYETQKSMIYAGAKAEKIKPEYWIPKEKDRRL